MSLLLALVVVPPVEPTEDPTANAFYSRRKRIEKEVEDPVVVAIENDEALLLALLL